jgi:FixJ family two-component response regulator
MLILRTKGGSTIGCLFRRKGSTIVSTFSMISIIDDDASVRTSISSLLRSLGYSVQTFASAEEFLGSGPLNDMGCVIADVKMPGMSGVDLQALLLARGHRMLFIFITAFPEESVRQRALNAGAICFLSKPFDGPTLIRCLERALGKSED